MQKCYQIPNQSYAKYTFKQSCLAWVRAAGNTVEGTSKASQAQVWNIETHLHCLDLVFGFSRFLGFRKWSRMSISLGERWWRFELGPCQWRSRVNEDRINHQQNLNGFDVEGRRLHQDTVLYRKTSTGLPPWIHGEPGSTHSSLCDLEEAA